MKRIFFSVVILAAMLAGCKKGENDPAISLKSRKARLVGEWKLSAAENTSMYDGYTEIYKFDDGKVTYTEGSTTIIGTGDETMIISKDGTYEIKRTITLGGSTEMITEEGLWYFVDNNKANDVSSKELVLKQCTFRSSTGGGYSSIVSYTGVTAGELDLSTIDQLKSKELIFVWDETHTSGSNIRSTKGSSTYVQK